MLIVADQAIPFLDGVFEPFADVVRMPGREISASDVRCADALIVRTRTRCDAALLEGSSVKLVITATIGFDHIDTGYCRRRGIRVVTAAGSNARGVLQWVAGTLARLCEVQGWSPRERTLGIVGVGHVGRLVEEYSSMWGFRVLRCDPPRAARGEKGFVTLERIAAESDIVTFHTPLDTTTRHLAGERFFAALRRECTVINSSRGEVVDTAALLRSGLPCAVDVWENEPDIDRRLLDRAVVATPHIAGYSAQGKANASAIAVAAAAEHLHLPVEGWYPPQVAPASPQPIEWDAMRATIGRYFDADAETRRLREHPEEFERLRNDYRYRNEYF
ncbi:MAG: 4-phosphoerythronate dehydrogenase [Alistipes sp.]|nr:4-phosphoerythronate dehydrogenase [Alistipes sp.]